MTTTTNVAQVKLNVMTQSQYNSATKNPTELYMITDAKVDYDDLDNKPTIPTESTVSGWGFTKNVGTVTSVNNTQPDVNGNVTITIPDTATWGNITGTLSNQTDLQNALDAKANSASLATVATSGSYNDLSDKPTIPAAQVNADWNASSGVAQILNKPTIPTVNNATLTIQKNGTTVNTFTANASSNVTANITVPTNTNELTNGAGFITGISSSDITTALGYTPANDSNVVKTSGGQTIAGDKTFTNPIRYNGTSALSYDSIHSSATKGTTPSTNAVATFSFLDSTFSGSYVSTISRTQYGYDTSGNTYAKLQVFKPVADSTQIGTIAIYYPSSGNPYTEAPTPDTSDNSTKIATTAYVKNQGYWQSMIYTAATETLTLS